MIDRYNTCSNLSVFVPISAEQGIKAMCSVAASQFGERCSGLSHGLREDSRIVIGHIARQQIKDRMPSSSQLSSQHDTVMQRLSVDILPRVRSVLFAIALESTIQACILSLRAGLSLKLCCAQGLKVILPINACNKASSRSASSNAARKLQPGQLVKAVVTDADSPARLHLSKEHAAIASAVGAQHDQTPGHG